MPAAAAWLVRAQRTLGNPDSQDSLHKDMYMPDRADVAEDALAAATYGTGVEEVHE